MNWILRIYDGPKVIQAEVFSAASDVTADKIARSIVETLDYWTDGMDWTLMPASWIEED